MPLACVHVRCCGNPYRRLGHRQMILADLVMAIGWKRASIHQLLLLVATVVASIVYIFVRLVKCEARPRMDSISSFDTTRLWSFTLIMLALVECC